MLWPALQPKLAWLVVFASRFAGTFLRWLVVFKQLHLIQRGNCAWIGARSADIHRWCQVPLFGSMSGGTLVSFRGFHHFFMLKASFFMEIHRTLAKFQDIDKRLTKNDKKWQTIDYCLLISSHWRQTIDYYYHILPLLKVKKQISMPLELWQPKKKAATQRIVKKYMSQRQDVAMPQHGL